MDVSGVDNEVSGGERNLEKEQGGPCSCWRGNKKNNGRC